MFLLASRAVLFTQNKIGPIKPELKHICFTNLACVTEIAPGKCTLSGLTKSAPRSHSVLVYRF